MARYAQPTEGATASETAVLACRTRGRAPHQRLLDVRLNERTELRHRDDLERLFDLQNGRTRVVTSAVRQRLECR